MITLTPELEKQILELAAREGANVRDIDRELNLAGTYHVYAVLAKSGFDYDVQSGEISKPEPEEDETPAAVEEEEDDSDAIPELLPFRDAPGYYLDPWGVPHGSTKRGRKAGKIRMNRYQAKGTKKWNVNYQLTVGKKRRTFIPYYLAVARTIAEREWKAKNRG
jgi:hypothetical protein